jgi:hypothetical protein
MPMKKMMNKKKKTEKKKTVRPVTRFQSATDDGPPETVYPSLVRLQTCAVIETRVKPSFNNTVLTNASIDVTTHVAKMRVCLTFPPGFMRKKRGGTVTKGIKKKFNPTGLFVFYFPLSRFSPHGTHSRRLENPF